MADELVPNALVFIRLSYEEALFGEHLQGIETVIGQAGLKIRYFRRFTAQELNITDHVVEIIAN